MGYKFTGFELNGIVSQQRNARNVKGNDADVVSVFATFPSGGVTWSAGYSSLNDKTARNWDVSQFNVSALYWLSRRTSIYGTASAQKVGNGGKAHMLLLTSSDSEQAQYTLGLRHTF